MAIVLRALCYSQSEEDKLTKLEHTLEAWNIEHLGRTEISGPLLMLFHYTSCEVCPHLSNLQFFLLSALLLSSY